MNRVDFGDISDSELIEQLFAVIEQMALEIAELKARLGLNSTNSSVPPSSIPYDKPKSLREPSGKNPGGQPGHTGNGFSLPHAPDQTIVLEPAHCASCGAELDGLVGEVSETRYSVDVEVKVVVTAYEQMEVTCPNCGTSTVADFPANVSSTKQYGEGVDATVVLLNQYANVSMDKTSKLLGHVLGLPISTGTVANIVNKCADNCTPTLEHISESLKKSKVLHVDETGMRVEAQNYWLHNAGNDELTYNTVSPKRGSEGTDANGVLKDFGGTAVHDCWKPYFKYDHCLHALCGAHLLRELNGIIENTGQHWAAEMKALICEMKECVDEYKTGGHEKLIGLPDSVLNQFYERYDAILVAAKLECPRAPKRKQSKARNLLERFADYKTEITRFATDFRVPFDNNQAERDIRNTKVKMKVSGGFRTEKGASTFAKISSVIGSAKKQAKNLKNVIKNIFNKPNYSAIDD